jgi:hypothetical protein
MVERVESPVSPEHEKWVSKPITKGITHGLLSREIKAGFDVATLEAGEESRSARLSGVICRN